ncbi:MAG TPA: hypothetical protein PK771_16220, partial [Spirochaetota bacterium]|nr:hypothetical protein [Spirochaetota bacterium]
TEEKENLLYITNPDSVYYYKSFFSKISSKFNTINWPDDKSVIKFIIVACLNKFIIVLLLIILLFTILFKYDLITSIISKLSFLARYKSFLILSLFLLVSILFRYQSFDKVIHVDEPTYLVMADRMVKGDLLYMDIVDNKAPILFLYYFIPMFLFNNLTLIRLFGALFIGVTAFIIYLVLEKILNIYINSKIKEKLKYIPIIGGISYIMVSSFHIWNFWINPEQIVIFFNSLALLFLLSNKKYSVFLSSLMLGFTFMTKYPAGIDYVAFAIIWFIIKYKDKEKIEYYLKNIIASIIGFLIPTALVVLLFTIQGNLKEFIDTFYLVTFKYPSKKTVGTILKTLFLFPKELGIIFVFFVSG